ncbi:hypothetical protein [Agaribacterium sp. ZY112]|uniref:hypothetical protein n=1 Tax=Agaribacterium sp. ZY112 TaxID=3233574 RepID=UPI0035242456
MSISEDIDKILSIQLASTSGLPDKLISSLDDLLIKYHPAEILASMNGLKEPYRDAELKARKSMGGSGMGAEFHIEKALKVSYLKQSVIYIERANKRRQAN